MKVIVATDGSEAALDAARRAITLLRDGAAIALAVVVPERYDPAADAGGFEGPVMSEEQAEEEYAEGQAIGNDALARTQAAIGTEAEVLLISTDEAPAEAIARVAAEQGADLIVVGSQEHGFLSRLFHGSTSDQVVHHAHCPVLVVPHET